MSKLVVILALYAATVSTLLLVQSKKDTRPGGAAPAVASSAGHPDLRKLMHEARALMSAEVKDRQKNIDLRLARLGELQQQMEDALATIQETSENAGKANYGKLETITIEMGQLSRSVSEDVKALQKTVAALAERVSEVEKRPVHVAPAPDTARPPKKTPAKPKDTRPKLPIGERKDPQVVAAEVAKAREDLKSNKLDVLFPAIEKIREHRVMDAVPRLVEIMAELKKEFGRAAAAAALGKMKAVDAVPALTEALVDRSDLVAQQANKSLIEITGFDTEMPFSAGMRKRRTIRNKVKEWWSRNEATVRERLRTGG